MGDQASKNICNCENYNQQQIEQNTETFPSIYQTDLNKTKKPIFQKSTQILLKVIASATLEEDLFFIITSNGLLGSNQQTNKTLSNSVFFGCKYKNQKNGYKINDIKIPCMDKQLAEKNRGQHFYIVFKQNEFYIKDLGRGFGCFQNINQIYLKNNMLLQIGSMYIICQICYGQDILRLPQFNNLLDVKEFIYEGFPCNRQEFLKLNRNQWYLRLHFYGGTAKDDIFILGSLNYKQITIGRNIDNLIRYNDDKLLSKYQCTLHFDGQWFLLDGITGKQSKNMTWLYINSETKLENHMFIKSNNTIFQVQNIYEQ